MIYVYIINAYFRNIIFSITYSWQLEKVVLFKLTEIKGILKILYIYFFYYYYKPFFSSSPYTSEIGILNLIKLLDNLCD